MAKKCDYYISSGMIPQIKKYEILETHVILENHYLLIELRLRPVYSYKNQVFNGEKIEQHAL